MQKTKSMQRKIAKLYPKKLTFLIKVQSSIYAGPYASLRTNRNKLLIMKKTCIYVTSPFHYGLSQVVLRVTVHIWIQSTTQQVLAACTHL